MRDAKLDRLFLRFRDKGDVRALSRVFDATSRELLEVAAHVSRDAAQAEDLLQTTFLIAIQRAREYDGSRRLMPWLVGILTREALLANRRAARRIEPDRVGPRLVGDPSVETEAREVAESVIEALDKLPELYREVLVRHLRDGKSAGEIARELDRAPGTVRVQIHRALDLLRKSLPAGLAIGAIGTLAPRGLGAVRAEVVRRGTLAARTFATTSVAGTTIATVTGGIVMKKLVVVAVVVLLCAGIWIASAGPKPSETSVPLAHAATLRVPALEGEPPSDSNRDPVSAPDRALIADAVMESNRAGSGRARGSVRIEVKWEGDGLPAAEVHVELVPTSEPWQTRRRIEAVTGADGVAHASGLDVGSWMIDIDRAACEAHAEIQRDQESRVEYTIPAGVDVEGLVVDGHGAPVDGAGIWLSSMHFMPGGRIVTHSARDGTFHLQSLHRQSHLGARAPHFASSESVWLSDPTLFGSKVRVQLELARPGQALSGIVHDPRGNPVPGARVIVGSELECRYVSDPGGVELKTRDLPDGSMRISPQALQAFTDEDGRFAIEGVETGDVPVVVWGVAASPWTGSVHIEADAPARLDVRLPASAAIVGVLTNTDRTPAAGFVVEAWGPTMLLEQSTKSDAQGAYRLEGVPLGEIQVQANRQRLHGAGTAMILFEIVAGSERRWDAVLAQGASIRGRVVDENGSPLAGWAGTARPARSIEDELYARTDANGRFTFEGCRDDLYAMQFHPPGAGANAMPSVWMTDIHPGTEDCVLRATSLTKASCRLRGSLVDARGEAVASARLRVVFAVLARSQEIAVERGDGRFEFGPLPPGSYTLSVSSPSSLAYHEIGSYALTAGQTLELGDLHVD